MSKQAKARVSAFVAAALGKTMGDPDRPVRLGILVNPDNPQGVLVAYDVESGTEFFVDITLRERPGVLPTMPVFEQDLSVEIPPTAGRGGW